VPTPLLLLLGFLIIFGTTNLPNYAGKAQDEEKVE
jgi:Sec-independent protein translocase protein TatA